MDELLSSTLVIVVVKTVVSTIGLIELLKNSISPPTKFWALIMLPVSLGVAYVNSSLPAWIGNGLLALTVTQIGYDTVYKGIKTIVSGLVLRFENEKPDHVSDPAKDK